MSKIYVDEILPKDAAKISAADLQLPTGSVVNCTHTYYDTVVTTTEPVSSDGFTYHSIQLNNSGDNDLIILGNWVVREVSGYPLRVTSAPNINGTRFIQSSPDLSGRIYIMAANSTDIWPFPTQYHIPASELSGNDLIGFDIWDGTGTSTNMEIRHLRATIMEIAQ